MSFRFGDCVFDVESRQLHRSGKPVPLTLKAFQLLELMLARRPKAVAKSEIYDRLWPSTFVSEVNLARLMFEIRTALGDDADSPRYVRTVRGFGYAFCGEVRETAGSTPSGEGAPWYALIDGEREFPLREGENVIGRSRRDTVTLQATSVSRRHALVMITPEGAQLEDLGSKNGTFVNGRRLDEPVMLADGDAVRFGTVTMSFRMILPEAPTTTNREEP